MTNYLAEINRRDLSILKNLYKSNGTKSYISYMTLDNYMRWFDQDPDVNHIKVFCLNGEYSDGTFVLTVSVKVAPNYQGIPFNLLVLHTTIYRVIASQISQDRNRAYTDTLNESSDRLFELLQLIDYSKGFRFLGIRPEIRMILKKSLQQINIEIVSDNKTILCYLSRDEALNFKSE